MTVSFTDILVLLALAGLAYLIVHYLPQIKQFLGTLSSDGKAAEQRLLVAIAGIEDLLHIHHKSVTDKIAAIPTPTAPPNTFVFGGSPASPAGTVTPPPAPVPTVNGIPTPAGMTWEQFNQLVVARQAVKGWLDPATDVSVVQHIVSAPDEWFASLGPQFVQELYRNAPAGAILNRVQQYITANGISVPPLSDAVSSAVNLAAGVK